MLIPPDFLSCWSENEADMDKYPDTNIPLPEEINRAEITFTKVPNITKYKLRWQFDDHVPGVDIREIIFDIEELSELDWNFSHIFDVDNYITHPDYGYTNLDDGPIPNYLQRRSIPFNYRGI